jgi:hypothetical protein
MAKRNFAWSAVVVFVLGACGGSSSTGTTEATDGGGPLGDSGTLSDAGGGILLSDIPPKYAAAFCAAYKNCLGADVYAMFTNGTDCAATTEQGIRSGEFPLFQSKVDQGKVVYDGTKAAACFDAITALTCADLSTRPIAACSIAIHGTVDPGGGCDLNAECKAPAFCKSASGTCPGTCTALLSAGQDCGADDECMSGLICSKETARCVQPTTAGQKCEYGNPPCGNGLVCMGKDDTNKTPGTCKTTADAFSTVEGAACSFATALCKTGLSCALDTINPLALKCVQAGSFAAGAACKPAIPEACAAGNYCKTAATAPLDGTCTPLPQVGEACGSNAISKTTCGPSLVCVKERCVTRAENGVSCASPDMCYSGKCSAANADAQGSCEAKLPCQLP